MVNKMSFTKWVRDVERMTSKDYNELPRFYQNKVKMNYISYCETNGIDITAFTKLFGAN